MTRTRCPTAASAYAGALLLTTPGLLGAVPLDPTDFVSIGVLAGESITIDTDLLTVDGAAGGVLFPQGGAPFGQQSGGPADIAVFTFGDGSVLGDVTVTGSLAAAILFRGAGTLTGTIDVSGASAGIGSIGAAGRAGGAGGGTGEPFGFGTQDGFGPGGGNGGPVTANVDGAGGGSGGGFGTAGGDAGAGTTFRTGGVAYGDVTNQLSGGSGGAGGGGHLSASFSLGGGGGAGGGAIEVGALTTLDLLGARINADGGDGGYRDDFTGGGGGGGAGGGILLHGFNVSIDATSLLTANGGDGGWGGLFVNPDGGCGGAGQIGIVTNSAGALTVDGQLQAHSGANGNQSGAFGTTRVGCSPVFSPVLLTAPDIGQAPATTGTTIPAPAPAALLLAALALLAARRCRVMPTG